MAKININDNSVQGGTQKGLSLPPPQLHELITALHRNKCKIQQRIRHNEKKMQQPEEQQRWAAEPARKLYLETLQQCRAERIKTIDGLLAILEPLKEN